MRGNLYISETLRFSDNRNLEDVEKAMEARIWVLHKRIVELETQLARILDAAPWLRASS